MTVTEVVELILSKKKLLKFWKLEDKVFSKAHKNIVASALTRMNYILFKLRISKLNISQIKLGFPKSYWPHDATIIQQLINDLYTIFMDVTIQDAELATQQSPRTTSMIIQSRNVLNPLTRMQHPVILHLQLLSI